MRFSWLRLRLFSVVLMVALVPAQAGTALPAHTEGAADAAQATASPAVRFIVKMRTTQDDAAPEGATARIGALAARHGMSRNGVRA